MKFRLFLVITILMVALVTRYYNISLLCIPLLLFWSRPKFIKETKPYELRILTYNLFMRPSFPCITHTKDDYKNERLSLFLKNHVESYDVMLLQELFNMFNQRQSRLLSDTYEHYAKGGAARYFCFNVNGTLNIPFLDAGVVSVSKFPITQWDRWVYTQGNKIDGLLPKCCIWTLLHVHEQRFCNVFNTHMQSSHSHWTDSFQSDYIRMKQVDEMVAFIKEKTEIYRYPALVGGDLNLDSRNFPLDYKRLMRLLKTINTSYEVIDLTPEHPITFGCPGETVFTMPSDVDSCMRLDYLIYIGPKHWYQSVETRIETFQVAGQPFTQLSDHYGISATFHFSH